MPARVGGGTDVASGKGGTGWVEVADIARYGGRAMCNILVHGGEKLQRRHGDKDNASRLGTFDVVSPRDSSHGTKTSGVEVIIEVVSEVCPK